MSDKNGNQAKVLRAIKRGREEIPDIMASAKLDELAVRNAIKRLQWEGEIRRKFEGGYAIVQKDCLLERYWTGVRPIWRFDEEAA